MVLRLSNRRREGTRHAELHRGPERPPPTLAGLGNTGASLHPSPPGRALGGPGLSTVVVFPMEALHGLRLLSLCSGAAMFVDEII